METSVLSKDENLILIDWFTFVLKSMDVDTVKDLLGLPDSWIDMEHGLNGYPKGIFFSSISILYGASDEMGICVNMSGQGCRSFESFSRFDWDSLFSCVSVYQRAGIGHITRLDIAFDDRSGILDFRRLRSDTEDGNYVGRFRSWFIEYGSDGSISIYHGSRKSDILLRIYDKAVERGFNGVHWIRIELQLRDDLAFSFIENVGCSCIGDVFCGVLRNYLRYVEPSLDSNKSRWQIADYWDELLSGASAIRLWSAPGVDYNASNLEHFCFDQCSGALRTYAKLTSYPELMNRLRSIDKPLAPKYRRLLQSYGLDS